jgi:hypothetical protein
MIAAYVALHQQHITWTSYPGDIMPLVKPVLLGLGLVAVVAASASAQTVSGTVVPGPSVASLPPAEAPLPGPRPSSYGWIPSDRPAPVAQSGGYLGPDPGKGWYRQEQHTQDIQPSPAWVGPKAN